MLLPPAPIVLAEEHTGLQQVRIARHPVFGGQLFLDGDLQISESDSAYGVAMVSPLLGLSRMSRVAILGGGDGGVLRELLRSLEPLAHAPEVTMVEIDARVVELCRRHLPAVCGDAYAHPRARLEIGDAFAWLARARDLDAVIYDLTMDPVREGQSRDDFVAGIVALVARALRPGGVFSMQCCGHGREDAGDRAHRRRLLPLIRQAVDAHFTDRCEQDVLVPSYRDLWTFLSARKPG
ncbi:spermine synthase [Pseudoxanthomonas broegbernensis]|nr:spermine synthase [Pseudoxanthomonas broegbernensis]MBB6063937.1 spermidine synthase/spermine synthase [Pseudoxanthomonas broegbernensis]